MKRMFHLLLVCLPAAVLLAGDQVADIAGMGGVALAEVVEPDRGGFVDGLLALQDAPAAEAVETEGEVQGRGDVLGREDVEVVGFLVPVG